MSSLKILRELNNYTQDFVASELGMDQSTYSKIERNPKSLRADQAEKLAQLYDVGLADLLSQGVTISFENNTIDKGYIHNHYEEFQKDALENILLAKDGEIQTLKEEIEFLRKQNGQLLEMLGKRP